MKHYICHCIRRLPLLQLWFGLAWIMFIQQFDIHALIMKLSFDWWFPSLLQLLKIQTKAPPFRPDNTGAMEPSLHSWHGLGHSVWLPQLNDKFVWGPVSHGSQPAYKPTHTVLHLLKYVEKRPNCLVNTDEISHSRKQSYGHFMARVLLEELKV